MLNVKQNMNIDRKNETYFTYIELLSRYLIQGMFFFIEAIAEKVI